MFFNEINKKAVLSFLLLSLGMHQAIAAMDTSTQANMQVTLEVLKSCAFTADKMDFGSQQSTSGSLQASSTLTVTCTKNTPFSITTSSDLSLLPVEGTGDNVKFGLYASADNTSPVDGTSALSGTGTGAAQPLTLWGNIPATELAKASAGKYQANVTLNMNY